VFRGSLVALVSTEHLPPFVHDFLQKVVDGDAGKQGSGTGDLLVGRNTRASGWHIDEVNRIVLKLLLGTSLLLIPRWLPGETEKHFD
jgi:hypothetical protein